MQYLVHTSGEVINRRDKAYVINAESKEKAQQIAKDNFVEEFCAIDENIYVKSSKRTYRAVFAYVLMLIPIGLSFINWKVGHNTVSMSPDYISCLYAILFYSAFVVRFKGIQRTIGSWIDIIFSFLIVLLLSSFIKTILVTKTLNIFWITEITINTNVMLPVVVILSWLGLKVVSAICMIGIGILAIFNLTALSNAMGSVYGPAYLICAFMGIIFYLSIEPALVEALPYLKKSVNLGLNYARNDIIEAGRSAKKFGDSVEQYKKRKTLQVEDSNEE